VALPQPLAFDYYSSSYSVAQASRSSVAGLPAAPDSMTEQAEPEVSAPEKALLAELAATEVVAPVPRLPEALAAEAASPAGQEALDSGSAAATRSAGEAAEPAGSMPEDWEQSEPEAHSRPAGKDLSVHSRPAELERTPKAEESTKAAVAPPALWPHSRPDYSDCSSLGHPRRSTFYSDPARSSAGRPARPAAAAPV